MKRLSLSLLLVLMALVGGCTMAPKYVLPEASVPPAWPEGQAYTDSLATLELLSAPEMTPQEFFQDNRLQRVLDLALANNLYLRLAALNVEKVQAYYKIKRANLYPTVYAAGAATKHKTPADLSYTGSAMTIEEYSINAGIASWEIDLLAASGVKRTRLGNSIWRARQAGEGPSSHWWLLLVSPTWLWLLPANNSSWRTSPWSPSRRSMISSRSSLTRGWRQSWICCVFKPR